MMRDLQHRQIAIIGAGPAGLFAAECLAMQGAAVTIYDRMPNVARKFLLAGRGGLNLSNAQPLEQFLNAYGDARDALAPIIAQLTPDDVRAWCVGLGEDIFVGSSGRIFPKSFKASPLLRTWLGRLAALNVQFALRHDWIGFADDHALRFRTPDGEKTLQADAVILALGGASWPRLGARGDWVPILQATGLAVTALRASNVGVVIPWSGFFKSRFAGTPLKRLRVRCGDRDVHGEAMITTDGLEGGAIYALSPDIRKALDTKGSAIITLDLRRDLAIDAITQKLSRPRGKESLSTYLKKTLGLDPATIALLREQDATGLGDISSDPRMLAIALKSLPLQVTQMQGLARAISTAGGVSFSALDDNLMVRQRPGLFIAGEMLDWDAPTGGYLLQACFATAKAAAEGVARYLRA